MRFKSYWRTTVVAAIFLHFFVWLGLALALPLLDFEGDPLAVQEMEVVDLPEEGSSGEMEEKKPDPPKPETPPVETPPEDVIPTETSPTEAAELDEAVAELQKQEDEAKKSGEDGKALPPAPPSQAVGVLITAGNTPDTRGTDFRGTVGILVSIDAQGHITGYRFTQTSGRRVVDQLVLNAIRNFKFEPALDTNGQPMKTMRLLRFPFDGSGSHAYEDDENKRIRVNKEMFLRELHARGQAPST